MAAPLLGMAKQMGSMMFGSQLGQGLGTLAGEVLGAADVGIPLTEDGRAALLPRNIAAFGAGLGVAPDEVRLYLALRETASQRLFAHVPWLRSQLTAAVEAYAAGIHVDKERIEEAARGLDPSNPESMQEILASGVFVPDDTPEQLAALARLETLLALVEGWVDDVVTQASSGRLPAADALRETMRRRRATGGPAEHTFATLVGLELRPRRLREAAALWESVRDARGLEARDALWEHPDLVPTPDDLDGDDAIEAFVRRSAPLDLSALDGLPDAPDEGGAPGTDA
jgi:putative hydrolase